MERQALIDMLNKDLADEHISVIRYLTHAYQEGEDTPFGSMLLAMAREEMWHMDWLGDVLGELGAEPEMVPSIYPHDPTSNATLLRSYIAWENNLIVEYARQAAMVDDPEIKRVLMQQSIESEVHSQRFAKMLEKLGKAADAPHCFTDTGEFSTRMLGRLQGEMSDEYKLMLQHLRDAFVFEDDASVSSELELTAMRHMKHLSHLAESMAEAGHMPQFVPPRLAKSGDLGDALKNNLDLTQAAKSRFEALLEEDELAEHKGLKIEVKQMINQETFLAEQVEEMLEGVAASEAEAQETQAAEPGVEPAPPPPEDKNPLGKWTVGSLIKKG
ncbi:MAG: ferritin-like domain-containing protein [Anaerolineae bacterium]|nr:ferritin-like domain-containing protein [Anaerolineae bacterium]